MNDKRHKIELIFWLLAMTLALVLTSSKSWREGHGAQQATSVMAPSSSISR